MSTPQSDASLPYSLTETSSDPSRMDQGPSPLVGSTEADEGVDSRESIFRIRFGSPWQQALWLLLVLRLGLELAGFVWARLIPPAVFYHGGAAWVSLVIRGGPVTNLLSIWQRWDALWYQRIVENGYHPGDDSIHFQPLFPLLSRIVSALLGGHVVAAELVVSSAAFFGAMWMFYRLARLDVNPATARLSMLLLAFFPTGFFLVAPYTESLYLLVTLTALWFARRGHPWAAGLAGLAAGLSRTIGILIIIPLGVEYVRQRHAQGKLPGLGLLAAFLPAVGYVVLAWYQRYVVGEVRSPVRVAADWGDHAALPWHALQASWNYIAYGGDPIEILNLSSLLLFGILAVFVWRRLPLVYSVYVVPYIILMMCRETATTPLGAVSRYLLVLFPCFIALAMILRPRWQIAAGWLVACGMMQVVLFLTYVDYGFVG